MELISVCEILLSSKTGSSVAVLLSYVSYVVSYVAFVLPIIVLYLPFFRCLGKAVLHDCGLSWLPLPIYIYIYIS